MVLQWKCVLVYCLYYKTVIVPCRQWNQINRYGGSYCRIESYIIAHKHLQAKKLEVPEWKVPAGLLADWQTVWQENNPRRRSSSFRSSRSLAQCNLAYWHQSNLVCTNLLIYFEHVNYWISDLQISKISLCAVWSIGYFDIARDW